MNKNTNRNIKHYGTKLNITWDGRGHLNREAVYGVCVKHHCVFEALRSKGIVDVCANIWC